eukprot:13219-Heterococcus_DN1.PRE.1
MLRKQQQQQIGELRMLSGMLNSAFNLLMRELETQPLDNMAGYRAVKAAYARLFTKVDNSTGTSLSKGTASDPEQLSRAWSMRRVHSALAAAAAAAAKAAAGITDHWAYLDAAHSYDDARMCSAERQLQLL